MDINTIIFSRTRPAKKQDIVEHLSEEELLKVSSATILRIIKEVGFRMGSSKTLFLTNSVSNNWNAEIGSISVKMRTKDIKLEVYIQYYNTDTSKLISMSDFMKAGDYIGQLTYTDREGGMQTDYFRFTISEKAALLKEILKTYLVKKYVKTC